MKLKTRFNVLALIAMVSLGLLMFSSLIIREFDIRRESLKHEVSAAVASSRTWPAMFYYNEREPMLEELASLLRRFEMLDYAITTDPAGELIEKKSTSGAPVISSRRGNQDELSVIIAERKRGATRDDDKVGLLNSSDPLLVISVPVTTTVNPLTRELAPSAFAQANFLVQEKSSRFVIGYVEAGVTERDLWVSMTPFAIQWGLISSGLVLIAFLIVRSSANSIGKPLEQLGRIADQISHGEVPNQIRLNYGRNDEIADIAGVLNGVIMGVHKLKSQMDVDKSLLSLKVDAQQKKLSAAEEEVNQTRNRLKRVANIDPVTQLPNRRLILEQLDMLIRIASREQRHIGVLLIDIANLGKINDTLSHDVGDHVLREIANRLTETVRRSDVVSYDDTPKDVSRVSHDEFFVLLHGIKSVEDAEQAGRRILEVLTEPVTVGDQQILPMLFMGVAIAPDHGVTGENLLRAADIAANDSRLNNIRGPNLYDQSMDQKGSDRFQLEVDLGRADFDKELELHYQPQIDIESGEIIGAEALIRWNHPTRGLIPPFQFIPIAEETGMIVDMGDWILVQALRDFQMLKSDGHPVPKISVNVSALQLTTAFVDKVEAAVKSTGIDPKSLELELTESLLVEDLDKVLVLLNRLHNDIGVRLSVDDFGTGYSSLAYLAQFPLDELKVDRSFVIAMEKDENSAKVTGAIIAIGRELGLDIVAEGVDNPEQLRQLREFGAKVIQGFYFSKPLPLRELQRFIEYKPFREQLASIGKNA